MKKIINVFCMSLLACAQAHAMDNLDQINKELIGAAWNGNHQQLQKLLEAKANINHVDRHGNTALLFAVYYNRFDCSQALLSAKANINQKSRGGITPLMCANKPLCDILIEILLYQPNTLQQKKIISFFAQDNNRKKAGYSGLDAHLRTLFKSHFKAALYAYNKQNFEDSIAYQEANKLQDGPMKNYLLEKYAKKPDVPDENKSN